MSEPNLTKIFNVIDRDFIRVGEASTQTKKLLKQIGFSSPVIRKVAVSMYEGEINMVIHANGGEALVDIYDDHIEIWLKDIGPGIKDVEVAMKEGFSTASEEARNLGFGAGMGLANMKKYSDQMKIDTELGKGTTVWLRIDA